MKRLRCWKADPPMGFLFTCPLVCPELVFGNLPSPALLGSPKLSSTFVSGVGLFDLVRKLDLRAGIDIWFSRAGLSSLNKSLAYSLILLVHEQQRVSCVHSQILEAGNHVSGAATALIFYKGQLFAGYSDGTIRVWDIKGQTMKLLCEVQEHKKAVTCFTLSDPGNNLLSGSADKTIRVWQMVQRKLECVEIIDIKESVKKLESYGDKIFVITQGRGLKEWRQGNKPEITIGMKKGINVLEMAAVEDFIYLNCSSSPSTLQIWLRDQQQKVGRLSAGSKIVSILTGNDIVLCGTESGLIKDYERTKEVSSVNKAEEGFHREASLLQTGRGKAGDASLVASTARTRGGERVAEDEQRPISSE
ncbi:hypothetical protein Taro_043930 [Colocasia esculenta]|uniref:Uncharacterized protein n=1 Tax=Colocasia esculenta TaxID=4460 RepID=A0A843X4S0_COLES|nr:hypothetical protein [Colocasia esculenta]